jgi:hypothetical protein
MVILNVLVAKVEVVIGSGNKMLYTWVKKVCHLWVQLRLHTFSQLLIIAEVPWSQPVFQIDENIIVARGDIRVLITVVKQLPVEMLQQRWSTSSFGSAGLHSLSALHACRSE